MNSYFLHPLDDDRNPALARVRAMLPALRPVLLDSEESNGMSGLLVLDSPALGSFEDSLAQVIRQETKVQVALHCRATFDAKAYQSAWLGYRELLAGIVASTCA